jgi:hypothetical protein
MTGRVSGFRQTAGGFSLLARHPDRWGHSVAQDDRRSSRHNASQAAWRRTNLPPFLKVGAQETGDLLGALGGMDGDIVNQ